ncbi:MAG: hypothetical protein HQK54_01430 [Oligoflexales bacterium]|nr:hypothetical protein [Oligoflexales bacterium]
MEHEDKIKHYMDLDYQAKVKKINGKFFVRIPELSLAQEGTDLSKVYSELESEKEKYFRLVMENDAEDEIILPQNKKRASPSLFNPFLADIMTFATKTVLLFAILFGGVYAGVSLFGERIIFTVKQSFGEMTSQMATNLSSRVRSETYNLVSGLFNKPDALIKAIDASTNITPSTTPEEKMALRTRFIMKRFAPIWDEIKRIEACKARNQKNCMEFTLKETNKAKKL